jgi:hypothetical protein
VVECTPCSVGIGPSSDSQRLQCKKEDKVHSPRVFFPEQLKLNARDAERFGSVTILCDRRLNPVNAEATFEALSAALDTQSYRPDEDFIGMSGNPVILSLLTLAASQISGRVRLLVFDAVDSSYKARTVDISNIVPKARIADAAKTIE